MKRHRCAPLAPDYFADHDPMPVEITEDGNGGSHPSPPYTATWDDLTRLLWDTGVLFARTGVKVRISRSRYYSDGRLKEGFFTVGYPGGSRGPCRPSQVHDFISGIESGLKIQQRADEARPGVRYDSEAVLSTLSEAIRLRGEVKQQAAQIAAALEAATGHEYSCASLTESGCVCRCGAVRRALGVTA